MRAVLILVVLMTALWCVAGAVGFTVYLGALAARSVWDRRRGVRRATSPPPGGLVMLLIGYSCVMAAIAAAAVWAQELFWIGMASWSALVASATVAVLRGRQAQTPSSVA